MPISCKFLTGLRIPGLAVIVFAAACNDQEPTPSYYRDLGDEKRSLLPPPGAWYDAADRNERAEWPVVPPFTPEEAAKRKTSLDRKGSKAGAGGVAQQEINGFLKQFNDALLRADVDAISQFFAESQRSQANELMKVSFSFLDKLTELQAVMAAKSPEVAQALSSALELFRSEMQLELVNVQIVNETQVKAQEKVGRTPQPGGPSELTFHKVEGQWKIESSHMLQAAASLPMLTRVMSQVDSLIAEIKSGSVTPDAVAKQLEPMLAMLGVSPSTAAKSEAKIEAKSEAPANSP